MSNTYINQTSHVAPATTADRTMWKAGLVSGLIAAAATAFTAAVARASDVPLAVKGEPIPISGFALLTMVGAVLGLGLAKILSQRASHPRRSFVRATVLLTALSIVPDVLAEVTTASKFVLALAHLIAAAIIVPSIALRLAR